MQGVYRPVYYQGKPPKVTRRGSRYEYKVNSLQLDPLPPAQRARNRPPRNAAKPATKPKWGVSAPPKVNGPYARRRQAVGKRGARHVQLLVGNNPGLF